MLRLLVEEPLVEVVHRGARARLAHCQVLRRSHDLERLGLVLDAVDVEDQLEPSARLGGRRRKRVKGLSPDLGDASCACAIVDVGDAVVPGVAVDDEARLS